jgi:hypothetical protein
MEPVGEHPVPAGPLAVRWLGYELPPVRAGTTGQARVSFENAGLAAWRTIRLSYHWLDDRGNPIVWDGWRTDLPRLDPGSATEQALPFRAPRPPGRYRLAFDLVDEERGWLSEVGNVAWSVAVDVQPRVERRALRALVAPGPGDAQATNRALARQDEPLVGDDDESEAVAHLVAGALPAPDWSRRVLDAHAEGFAAVGGALEPMTNLRTRSWKGTLRPWGLGEGRNPSFPRPLLLPSLLDELEPGEHLGLPAYMPDRDLPADLTEPWLYDARIRIELDVTGR